MEGESRMGKLAGVGHRGQEATGLLCATGWRSALEWLWGEAGRAYSDVQGVEGGVGRGGGRKRECVCFSLVWRRGAGGSRQCVR